MPRTATHYHIGSNIPGYLPDSDVYAVNTKRDATAAVADEVRRYRESEWDLPRSQRRTGHGSARNGYVKFKRTGDPYDLGIVFWWSACQDDCDLDQED